MGRGGTLQAAAVQLNSRRAFHYVPIPDSAPAGGGRAPPCFKLSLTASNIFHFHMLYGKLVSEVAQWVQGCPFTVKLLTHIGTGQSLFLTDIQMSHHW